MRRIVWCFWILILGLPCWGQELRKLGQMHQLNGEYRQAVEYFNKAVREPDATRALKLVICKNNLPQCYLAMGNYQDAAESYLRALQISPGDYRVKLNLSSLWIQMGLYQKVISLLDTLECPQGKEIWAGNLAAAYAYQGHTDRALQLNENLLGQLGERRDSVYAAVLANKGFMLWEQKQYMHALEVVSSAVKLTVKPERKYILLANQALIEAETGRFSEALSHIEEVLEYQKGVIGERHPDYSISLRKKAEIYLKQRNKKEAALYFRHYFERERSLLRKDFCFMPERYRQDYWNSRKGLLAEIYKVEDEDPRLLYDVALLTKSILLQIDLELEETVRLSAVTDSLYKEIQALKKIGYSDTSADTQDRKIEEKERELLSLVRHGTDFMDCINISLSEICKCLSPSEAAIEFVAYENDAKDGFRYAALLLTASGNVDFIPLMDGTDLGQYLLSNGKTLERAILSRLDTDKNVIYTDSVLGDKIWKPLRQRLVGKERIYFSADGLLNVLAIEYLSEQHITGKLYRLTSTRELLRKNTGGRNGGSLLLMGGLDYNCNGTDTITVNDSMKVDRTASRMLDELQFSRNFNFLEGTLNEVNKIDTLLKGYSVLQKNKVIRQQGSEAYFKSEAGKYTWIHLATHGFCVDNQLLPTLSYRRDSIYEDMTLLKSGLLLSGVNCYSESRPGYEYLEDGILSAREMSGLDLSHTDLVVLSACQTGLGRISSDGVFGIQRGLKKAGVKTIIASLWEVSDEATEKMMIFFYENLLRGMDKWDAFSLARRQIMAYTELAEIEEDDEAQNTYIDPRTERRKYPVKTVCSEIKPFKAPCYWAAFILLDAN